MELKSYWWLLIWLFTGGAILSLKYPKRKEYQFGKEETRWTWMAAIILTIPYVIWAGYRTSFVDTSIYIKTYDSWVPESLKELPIFISGLTKDKGFYIFEALVKIFISHKVAVFFLIIAGIQMLCIVSVYRKYSEDFWLSIFIFIASTDYMSWMHNGIRQFLAVTIIFAATDLLISRRYILLSLVIVFASLFHLSALLMLPIVFIIQGKAWNRRTVILILFTIVILMYLNQFTNVLERLLENTQYANVVSDWESFNDNGTNPIRILVYSVPVLISIIGIRYFQQDYNPIVNIAVNAGIIATVIGAISVATSGLFIGRLPIFVSLYSNGILLPWEINHIFSKESAGFIKLMAIVLYSLFFYIQMHYAWGIL